MEKLLCTRRVVDLPVTQRLAVEQCLREIRIALVTGRRRLSDCTANAAGHLDKKTEKLLQVICEDLCSWAEKRGEVDELQEVMESAQYQFVEFSPLTIQPTNT